MSRPCLCCLHTEIMLLMIQFKGNRLLEVWQLQQPGNKPSAKVISIHKSSNSFPHSCYLERLICSWPYADMMQWAKRSSILGGIFSSPSANGTFILLSNSNGWFRFNPSVLKIILFTRGVDDPATWAGGVGNSWRTTGDIKDTWAR